MARASDIRRFAIPLATALAALAPAHAQVDLMQPGDGRTQGRGVEEVVRPPDIEEPGQAPVWLYYLVGVGCIAICLGLAVFPSRREFND